MNEEYNKDMNVTPHTVCQDMFGLFVRIKQELLAIAEQHNLTQAQLAALYMLSQRGELAMGEVAHELHCDPSNVTGIVDRLTMHQLVCRKDSKTDRRAKNITLTDEGQKVINEIAQTFPKLFGCDKLNVAERQALHASIQKLLG